MMRIVSEHNCSRRHRNTTYFARCAWPGADVLGRGFLAIVCTCEHPRVFLVTRLRPAQLLRSELNVFGCGPNCSKEHELVAIDHYAFTAKEETA